MIPDDVAQQLLGEHAIDVLARLLALAGHGHPRWLVDTPGYGSACRRSRRERGEPR